MKEIHELRGKHYFTCCACMSVLADALSWANANKEYIVKNPEEADNIIIFSCQVTDLAVLNDFRIAEEYQRKYSHKNIFISGCLSEKLLIEFPNKIQRLKQMRANCPIEDKTLVHFEKPFWVKNFDDNEIVDEFKEGFLFRNKYPFRIGKGCQFNCAFCTIRITRGQHQEYDFLPEKEKEFIENDNIVLIADSPTTLQINYWCDMAIKHKKVISIRNIEPQTLINCKEKIKECAQKGFLEIVHCPIQSNNNDVLIDMKRNASATFTALDFLKSIKKLGVKIATNIIIDYKDFPNDFSEIYKIFDYVSWNPLWDGKWDRNVAESRYKKYIDGEFKCQ